MEQTWYNPFALNGHENTLKIVAQENGINADELIAKIESTDRGFLDTPLTEDEINLLKTCRFAVRKVEPNLYRVTYDFSGDANKPKAVFSDKI